MKYNYHTHTFRCGHATGEDRQYVDCAVSNGVEKMGFSDHAPVIFPDGSCSGYRVQPHMAQSYIEDIRALREEYRDKIELYVGFEMEYYPRYFEQMYSMAKQVGAEYLILGQHYVNNEFPNDFFSNNPSSDETVLKSYADNVVKGIRTGVYTYLAHPDVCNFTGEDSIYRREMKRICRAAKEEGMPLEINCLGIRGKRSYPDLRFWEIAGEIGCMAVTGCDAHSPQNAWDESSVKVAHEIAERFGLTLLDDPELRTLK